MYVHLVGKSTHLPYPSKISHAQYNIKIHIFLYHQTTCSVLEQFSVGSGGSVTVYLSRYDVSSSIVASTSSFDSSF